MTLFPETTRSDPAPARGAETTFEFLDRVQGPFWDRLRALLNQWVRDYPAQHRTDVQERLRSSDDQFQSAWWELYLFTALSRSGRQVVVHPSLAWTTRRPDFLVREPDGTEWLLEAAVVVGSLDGDEQRRADVVDALNSMETSDLWLAIQWRRTGACSPSLRSVKRFLAAWIR